jgi:hypothetical protein
MPCEHDHPDPNLIIQGTCHVQPSKRGLGNDYPVTPLEELRERDKCKRIIRKKEFLKLTFICKVTLNDLVIPTSDDGNWMEEGSSSVSNLGNTERVWKDRNMPDGDTCRLDGTLKDASEMEWPNSLSDLPETSNNDYF